jgi:hypothetical protein
MKRSLAAILASTIGFSSGAMLATLNEGSVVYGHYDDSTVTSQERFMMDGNNFLKSGFVMYASISTNETDAEKYDATLKFTIPGYDINNLKFYVLNKNLLLGDPCDEYTAESDGNVVVSGLDQTSYEVHVYNGSLAKENFVCKAEFSCIPDPFNGDGDKEHEYGVVDADGTHIADSELVTTPTDLASCYQAALALSSDDVPYETKDTVKVVFFAQESDRDGKPVNIDKDLYDCVYYVPGYDDESGETVVRVPSKYFFFPDANYGLNKTYEAHFYKNEVKSENFICKVTGITLS